MGTWIDAVLVEKVDVVGLESLERGLGHGPDALRTAVHAARGIAILEVKLGGNHHLVADRCQGFAHDLLVRERAVGFGRVKEGDAVVKGRTDQRKGLLPLLSRTVAIAQSHAAESESWDFQTAFS